MMSEMMSEMDMVRTGQSIRGTSPGRATPRIGAHAGYMREVKGVFDRRRALAEQFGGHFPAGLPARDADTVQRAAPPIESRLAELFRDGVRDVAAAYGTSEEHALSMIARAMKTNIEDVAAWAAGEQKPHPATRAKFAAAVEELEANCPTRETRLAYASSRELREAGYG